MFSSQFPLLRLCLCLSNSLLPSKDRAPASSSGTGKQRGCARPGSGAAAAPALPTGPAPTAPGELPEVDAAAGACKGCRGLPGPHLREGTVLSVGCLAKGLGHRKEAASKERVSSRSSEPFGETRLLLSSVPLFAAPPQNGLFFLRPLDFKVF